MCLYLLFYRTTFIGLHFRGTNMLDLEEFRLVAANACCCVNFVRTKVWPGLQLIRCSLLVFLAVVVVEVNID